MISAILAMKGFPTAAMISAATSIVPIDEWESKAEVAKGKKLLVVLESREYTYAMSAILR